jgi:hypothetical protein
MNPNERIQLDKLLKQSEDEYIDNTSQIRKLQHSSLIRKDVLRINELRRKHKIDDETSETDMKLFKQICRSEAHFMFTNYTNIFNRLVKGTIDLKIFDRFISVLREIEIGELDQNDGSYKIGTLLKRVYIDSALKEDAQRENAFQDEVKEKKKPREISWKAWNMVHGN